MRKIKRKGKRNDIVLEAGICTTVIKTNPVIGNLLQPQPLSSRMLEKG